MSAEAHERGCAGDTGAPHLPPENATVADRALRSQLSELAASPGSPEWLRRLQNRGEDTVRDAAVLMLFGRGGRARTEAGRQEAVRLAELGVNDVDIVLLQRADTLRHHPGQVAFPGGGREPQDASLTAAALREAEEEAGIVPDTVEVLGTMDPLYIPVSRFEVTPVIGYWRQPGTVQVMDTRESYSVYRVAIADLVAPANRGTFARPDLKFSSPAFDVGVLKVWGFTAGILDFALDHLRWAGEWDQEATIAIDF